MTDTAILLDELSAIRREIGQLRSVVCRAIDDSGSWVSAAKAATSLCVSHGRFLAECRKAWLDRPDARQTDVTVRDGITVRYVSGPAEGRKLYRFMVWAPDLRPAAAARNGVGA